MKHELVQLAGKVDWEWIDGQIAPLYSANGRPAIETRFMLGLSLLKHICGLSDSGHGSIGSTTSVFASILLAKSFSSIASPHERPDSSHSRKLEGSATSWNSR